MTVASVIAAHAQVPFTNSLIAYYPFSGTAADESHNGHTGTLFGAAAYGVDRFGNSNSCLALPGTAGIGSGVDIPSLDSMPYMGITYSAWFFISNYPPLSGLSVMTLVGREQCGQQSDGALLIITQPSLDQTNDLIYFGGSTGYSAAFVPPTNKWCQVVLAIAANGTVNYYFNGTNLPGSGSVVAGVTEDFRIGASGGEGCSYEYVWNGRIDDVRIYNRALASNEVQELYAYESVPGACPPYPAAAVATVTNGFCVGATVTEGGCGYTNTPLVLIKGGGGTGAAAVAEIGNGVVTGITISNPGSGYSTAPVIYIGSLPSITNQPQSLVVDAYGTAAFGVSASGTVPTSVPFAYQWSYDGTNISGATSNVLTITNITPINLGSYAVVVTNVFGSVTSSIATLSMYPYLTEPFTGLVTDWGYTNTLSVQAWGTGPLSYQWYDNGAAIADATNQMLNLADIQFTNAGLYSVVVTSPFGSTTNTPEEVVVNPAGSSLGLYPGLTISGVTGFTYIIQRSANLSDTNSWVTVTNLTLTQPVQLWVDTNINSNLPGNPQEYTEFFPANN